MISKVLVVDLDGTLIREESHWVLWQHLRKTKPLEAAAVLLCRLRKGSAAAKEELVARCSLSDFVWTLNAPLLQKLNAHARAGFSLILITGAPLQLAQIIAQKVGIFDHIMASTRRHNLVGTAKVHALETFLKHRNFIYVGNSFKDIPVWRYAAQAWVVRPSWLLRWAARFFLKDPLFLL